MEWEVWVDNIIEGHWTFEFSGTRDECLRYMDLATDSMSHRLWNFVLINPQSKVARTKATLRSLDSILDLTSVGFD